VALDEERGREPPRVMLPIRILSAIEARKVAHEESRYALWVRELDAVGFSEPGWVKLEPPRNGAVLFLNREREYRAARRQGVL
jgi:hypothetical protein